VLDTRVVYFIDPSALAWSAIAEARRQNKECPDRDYKSDIAVLCGENSEPANGVSSDASTLIKKESADISQIRQH
jgi:hypothetical protein